MGVPEESQTDPRISVRKMIEHHLTGFFRSEISRGVAWQSVEEKNTRVGRNVNGQFAQAFPGFRCQGVSSPTDGVSGSGIEPVRLGKIAGSLFMVARDEDSAQVRHHLQAGEGFGPVSYGITETPDRFDTLCAEMLLDCLEGREVGVDIGEDSYSHIFLYHELCGFREKQLKERKVQSVECKM
jgi:hypothetical protein